MGTAGTTPGGAPSSAETANGEEDFGEGDELDTAVDDNGRFDEASAGNDSQHESDEPRGVAGDDDAGTPRDPDQQ